MKNFCWVIALTLLTTGIAFAAPKTAPEYFAMATQLYKAKDYQGAAYAYEAGLVLDPTSAAGYQGMGDCYYFMGRQTDAMIAYLKSLELNPNNPKLADFVKSFKPQDTVAQEVNDGRVVVASPEQEENLDETPSASKQLTVMTHSEAKFALDNGNWIRAYAGYDFAFLNDMINGINAWGPVFSAEAASSSNGVAEGNGLQAGLEYGLLLDPGNALSISLENVWTQTESYSNGGIGVGTQSGVFQPDLMSVLLSYYAYIPAKGSRTYFTLGVGYYEGVVGFSGFDPTLPVPAESGTFSGAGIGETFGLGETLAIGKSFGLELSARARIVTFNQITAPSINNGGTITNGPYAIVINSPSVSTAGPIYVTPVSNIGSTYRYMILDYSGFDGDISFNFYF